MIELLVLPLRKVEAARGRGGRPDVDPVAPGPEGSPLDEPWILLFAKLQLSMLTVPVGVSLHPSRILHERCREGAQSCCWQGVEQVLAAGGMIPAEDQVLLYNAASGDFARSQQTVTNNSG